jgi:hypothetical protein
VKQSHQAIAKSIALLFTCFLGTAVIFAQETVSVSDALSGKYVGTAKIAGCPDAQVTLELKNESGKISGHFISGPMTMEISEGNLADGKLSLKFGPDAKDGTLSAKVDGDNITGDWLTGANKKAIELRKAVAASGLAAAAAPINLSGQWDAVADAQGQPFPFLLTLKVDGEKVSGSSSSQLGDSNISTGSWKDGRLSFQLEGTNGAIVMSATVIEGKLSGEFDFAGQLQGKWVAIKKN